MITMLVPYACLVSRPKRAKAASQEESMIVRAERRLRLCRPLGRTNRLPSGCYHERVRLAAVVVCLVVLGSAPVSADTTLIPRRTLFADADRPLAALSPGGERIAYIEVQDGTRSAWVARADDLEARTPVALLDDG